MVSSDHSTANEVTLKAREGLIVEKQGEKFILHDAVKNTFTQLGAGEYLVFRCFDGKSTAQDIADRLKKERDVSVNVPQILRLRDRLHEKQLIIAPDEQVLGAEDFLAGRSLVQRLITIDLGIAINPDVLLTRLYHRIKYWAFRPAFFVCLAIVACMAIQVWVTSWDEIRHQLSVLDLKASILIFYPCAVITILIHEVGHGVSTRGFGGAVPKMGVLLYFFVIVFYTDVSASWMFASKFRRLMVLFAGAITNVAQWSLWTVIWQATLFGSLVNRVAFAFMMINAVSLTFTLFPLLRGDGYYILSTALDIPNLSQNAHRYVRARLRKRFIDKMTPLPKATNRESLIYVCYSPLQVTFFLVFFTVLATRTASWLIDRFGFVGFWILAFVVADRIGRPVFRIIPGMLKLLADALRLELSKGPRPLLSLLLRPVHDASRWITQMWRIELLIGVVIGLLAVIPYHLHINAPFQVISSGPVVVRARTSGIVKQYLVKSGDLVKAGDVIAVLMDDDLKLRRRIVAASLDEARVSLAETEAGYRHEDVAEVAVRVDALRQTSRLAADALGREKNLYAQQISSRKELDAAKSAYQSALAGEHEAEAELGMMRRGYRSEERERRRASMQRVEQELAAVDQRLAWTQVRALVDGRVLTPQYELEQRIGKHVAIGDGLADVIGAAQLAARITVPERFVSEVAPGMPVTLRFYKDPDVGYEARLDRIELAVTVRDGQPGTLGMSCNLSSIGGTLPLGTTGIAKIDAGSRSILALILERARSSAWVVFWSWW